MSRTPIISADHIGICYRLRRKIAGSREFWAVRDVTLDIFEGETLGVLGSNGAGKSTLMRALAGILAVDRGRLTRDPRYSVALLSLGVGFEANLTGRENAILSGMLLGLHRATIEKRLARVLDFSELGEFFDQPVYTYSSGMLARLGFSVAIQVDPDVLLVDEVLAVGDAHFQRKSAEVLSERIKRNRAVVLITHDIRSIQAMCDRAVWIDRGVSRVSGSVADVQRAYEEMTGPGPDALGKAVVPQSVPAAETSA